MPTSAENIVEIFLIIDGYVENVIVASIRKEVNEYLKQDGGKNVININFEGKLFEVRDVPVHPREIETDTEGKETVYRDPTTGKKVKKYQLGKATYKWAYEDGTEFTGKACKSVKGKPIAEFTKTTKLDSLEKVDAAKFLMTVVENEHCYYLVGNEFKAALKKAKSGFVFKPFKIRGLKAYKALIYYDEVLDRAIMRLCRGELNCEEMPENDVVQEAEVSKGELLSDADVVC